MVTAGAPKRPASRNMLGCDHPHGLSHRCLRNAGNVEADEKSHERTSNVEPSTRTAQSRANEPPETAGRDKTKQKDRRI